MLPLGDGADAGILGGGSVAAVSAKATAEEEEAAVAWNDFYREKKNYDQDAAVADAEVLKASDQPIGTPTLPIFDEATWQTRQDAIEPYVNVPRDQMTSFTDGVFDQKLIPEPASHTQEVYAILDSVVQKVLTDENADIDALLTDANDQAQQLLDAAADRSGPAGARPRSTPAGPARCIARTATRTRDHDRSDSPRRPPPAPRRRLASSSCCRCCSSSGSSRGGRSSARS